MDCIPLELFNASDYDGPWFGNLSLSNHGGYGYQPMSANGTSNATKVVEQAVVLAKPNNIFLAVENFLYSRLIVVICIFGVFGNVLNLLVLTRKGLQKHMDRMEKSAHYGLVALALSDMLFCFAVIPNAWVDKQQFYYSSRSFNMYYKLYGDSVINAFIMASTWLTVAMATSRYLAICHPLRARDIIGMTFAKLSIVLVFVLCVLFNLPRFWNEDIEHMDCVGGSVVYFPRPGIMKRNKTGQTAYMWLYFVFGILVPLIALAFCNINLIRALQQSTKMRRKFQNKDTNTTQTTHHITLTLIIIVIMYFVLVVPAEAINFIKDVIIEEGHATDGFNVANAVVNTLQAINFACNFILYCAVNVHFRRTLVDLFCWCCFKRSRQEPSPYESVTVSQSGYTRNTAVSEF